MNDCKHPYYRTSWATDNEYCADCGETLPETKKEEKDEVAKAPSKSQVRRINLQRK